MFVSLLKALKDLPEFAKDAKKADKIIEDSKRLADKPDEMYTAARTMRTQDGTYLLSLDPNKAKFNSKAIAKHAKDYDDWVNSDGTVPAPKAIKLSDVFDHEDLFKLYPQLKDYEFDNIDYLQEFMGGYRGSFQKGANQTAPKVSLAFQDVAQAFRDHANAKKGDPFAPSKDRAFKQLKSRIRDYQETAFHEIQHAIQDLEGRPGGGNSQMFVPPKYRDKLSGVGLDEKSKNPDTARLQGQLATASSDFDKWKHAQYLNIIGEIEARKAGTQGRYLRSKERPYDPKGLDESTGILPKQEADYPLELREDVTKEGTMAFYYKGKTYRFPLKMGAANIRKAMVDLAVEGKVPEKLKPAKIEKTRTPSKAESAASIGTVRKLFRGEDLTTKDVDDLVHGLKYIDGVPAATRERLQALALKQGEEEQDTQSLVDQIAEVYMSPDVEKAGTKGSEGVTFRPNLKTGTRPPETRLIFPENEHLFED